MCVFLCIVCSSLLRAVGVRCWLLFGVAGGAVCDLRLWLLLCDAFCVLFNVCCCVLFAVCCLPLRWTTFFLSFVVDGLCCVLSLLVFAVWCMLCAVCCYVVLNAAGCRLLFVYFRCVLLLVACGCLLCGAWCLPLVTAGCCLLPVACCLLFAICCLLFVVCCLLALSVLWCWL